MENYINAANGAEQLICVLAGAIAEGVDMGPRGVQIRKLGRSLEKLIEALRLELEHLCCDVQIDGQPLDIAQLAELAHTARTYGRGAVV